jgi:hypothetical protein
VGIAFIVSLVLQVAYPQLSFYSGRSIAGFHKSGDFFSLSACVEFGGVTGTKRGFAISVFLTDTKLLFYLDVCSCIYVPQLGLDWSTSHLWLRRMLPQSRLQCSDTCSRKPALLPTIFGYTSRTPLKIGIVPCFSAIGA